MRTPKEYTKLLNEKKISENMLSDCLYSVNKRAKNYRDNAREKREMYGRGYTEHDDSMKEKYYAEKEFLLSVLEPKCVHREFAGYERERIYDYDPRYNAFSKKNAFVWENCYYDHDEEREVWFGDVLDKSSRQYRYYLFYELGTHSFHTPIEEFEIPENLDVIDIDELDTYGDGIENLLSNVFVTKVMLMIYSGDYELTFTDSVKEKKPVWDKCPDFLVKAEAKKTEKKEKTVFQAPETEITTILTWEKKEVEAIEYIVSEINSKHGPSKEDVIALARQKGMKTSAKTKKCEATEYLRGLGLLESYATQCRIGVTKFDFLRAGMRDSEYKYLTSKKRLRPISQYESESGRHKHMVNIYSIGQYLKWRNTGAVV